MDDRSRIQVLHNDLDNDCLLNPCNSRVFSVTAVSVHAISFGGLLISVSITVHVSDSISNSCIISHLDEHTAVHSHTHIARLYSQQQLLHGQTQVVESLQCTLDVSIHHKKYQRKTVCYQHGFPNYNHYIHSEVCKFTNGFEGKQWAFPWFTCRHVNKVLLLEGNETFSEAMDL